MKLTSAFSIDILSQPGYGCEFRHKFQKGTYCIFYCNPLGRKMHVLGFLFGAQSAKTVEERRQGCGIDA
jgi:hypothetical protein